MKSLFRKIIRPVLYYLYYLPFKKSINVSREGKPLMMGITAVVAMKNEEYTLPFCLESLIGFADQIVIIDNGSEDSSLEKAKAFKNAFGNKVEVDIIELPGALLGDCREAGLKAACYQWHLRWDADMVAHTDGANDMKKLREKILKDNTPRAIQLPRVNIYGDLQHAMGEIIDPGEPILIWFNKAVFYKEYGKFDSIKVPFYFRQDNEMINYYFHCSGLKSDENLIHRFHYFTWREYYNHFTDKYRPQTLQSFEAFKSKRNLYLLGTIEKKSIKYRYMRQLVSQFVKFNTQLYGDYPKILEQEIQKSNSRFQIIYFEYKPLIRIDNLDEEMKDYKPSEEDKNWDIDTFFKKLFKENKNIYQ
jgi:glycosyltransferase involved in cell wall biosynthesis